jgi:hypothetical protein
LKNFFYLNSRYKEIGESKGKLNRKATIKSSSSFEKTSSTKSLTNYHRRKTMKTKFNINEDDSDEIYLREIQKLNENDINSKSIIDIYNTSVKTFSALTMLHDKINEDIKRKNIEYAGLKRELERVKHEHAEQNKIHTWLEDKDQEFNKKVENESLEPEVSTINLMKMKLLDSDKPKTSDYIESYKSAIRIYEHLKPETFIVKVTCLVNEMLRQIAYKLWK